MSDLKALHREAMELVDESLLAKRAGKSSDHLAFLRRAFELERAAADAVQQTLDMEPTRSVLHRSAASMALELGEIHSAERLIYRALLGNPPEELAEELRDLLEQVSFGRHLQIRGIDLLPEEFQLSFAGDSVGLGIAQSDVVIDRIQTTEKLLYRTAERNSGQPYRERGSVRGALKKPVEVYVSVPRAASFAVSFRLGREQMMLPEFDIRRYVTDEFLDCLELFTKLDAGALRERIPDTAYYLNFLGLARAISPDGKSVRQVGFTTYRAGQTRAVALTRPRAAIPPTLGPLPSATADVQEVTIRGWLRAADAVKEGHNMIRIVPDMGSPIPVLVPEGMMDDIVRPMWNSRVEIVATRRGKEVTLAEIDRVIEEQRD